MKIIKVIELMNCRMYDTSGWGIFVEMTENTMPGKSDKLISWEARQLMRMVEAMCGYSV